MAREMSVAQAAKAADCHPETIRRAIRTGELKVTRHPTKPGRPYVIDAQVLADFLKERAKV